MTRDPWWFDMGKVGEAVGLPPAPDEEVEDD